MRAEASYSSRWYLEQARLALSAMASHPYLLSAEAMEILDIPRAAMRAQSEPQYQEMRVRIRNLVVSAIGESIEAGTAQLQRAEAEAKIYDALSERSERSR